MTVLVACVAGVHLWLGSAVIKKSAVIDEKLGYAIVPGIRVFVDKFCVYLVISAMPKSVALLFKSITAECSALKQ